MDKGFTEKLLDAHKKNAEVIATVKGKSAGEGFCIKHFAGDVTYSTGQWLNKNKDPLNGDLMVLMQFSNNSVLKELFSAEAAPAGAGGKFKSNKFKGIISAFCTGLDQLYAVLDSSALHFVRCFKPNDAKKGGQWVDEVVTRQLHTSGVLDALRVARTGYPDRMPFEEFFGMYSFVGGMAKGGGDQKAKCADLCAKLKLTGKEFKLGREKIFLALGVKGNLNALRNQAMAGVAGKLQAAARGMNARGKVRVIREARGEVCEAMADARQGDDIELLRKAINAAKALGVGKSKYDESGKDALAVSAERLAVLEKLAAERKAAELALTKLVEAKVSSTGPATALDGEVAGMKAAIAAAKAKGVNAEAVAAGGGGAAEEGGGAAAGAAQGGQGERGRGEAHGGGAQEARGGGGGQDRRGRGGGGGGQGIGGGGGGAGGQGRGEERRDGGQAQGGGRGSRGGGGGAARARGGGAPAAQGARRAQGERHGVPLGARGRARVRRLPGHAARRGQGAAVDRRPGAAGGGPRGLVAVRVAQRRPLLRQPGDHAGALAAPARLPVPADLPRAEEGDHGGRRRQRRGQEQ